MQKKLAINEFIKQLIDNRNEFEGYKVEFLKDYVQIEEKKVNPKALKWTDPIGRRKK